MDAVVACQPTIPRYNTDCTYLSSRLMSLVRAGIQGTSITIELQRTATGEPLSGDKRMLKLKYYNGILELKIAIRRR